MNTCTRTITGFLLAATTAVALATPANAAPSAPPATAAPAATSAASAAPTPRSVVNYWYSDFLGRYAPDDPGSQHWVDRIAAGAKPADVLWAITHTNEYNSNVINYYYEAYLNRAPDAGSRYWLEGANAQRFPLEWAEQNIAASPEAVKAANRRGDLIQTWYLQTLGRGGSYQPASAGEVSYWKGRVRAVGALGAFRELYYTPEAVTHRIGDWYQLLPEREPRAEEVAYWYPKEVESDINVGVLIGATPEYAALTNPDG